MRPGFGCVYALQRILFALETSPDDKSEAYFYAFVTFLLHLSFAQVDVFQEFFTRRSYERVRGMVSIKIMITKNLLLIGPTSSSCVHYISR